MLCTYMMKESSENTFRTTLVRSGLEHTIIILDVHGTLDNSKIQYYLPVALFYKTADSEAPNEEIQSKFQEPYQQWYVFIIQ